MNPEIMQRINALELDTRTLAAQIDDPATSADAREEASFKLRMARLMLAVLRDPREP